jgi:hypothetical protein
MTYKVKDLLKKFGGSEEAAGAIEAQDWGMAVVKVACILIIGVLVLEGIVDAAPVNASDPFYDLAMTVRDNITNGYTLAGLIVLILGASAIMHFLGFM